MDEYIIAEAPIKEILKLAREQQEEIVNILNYSMEKLALNLRDTNADLIGSALGYGILVALAGLCIAISAPIVAITIGLVAIGSFVTIGREQLFDKFVESIRMRKAFRNFNKRVNKITRKW